MSKRLLRLKQIIPGRVPVSKSSWWKGIKEGRFPKPIKLGPRTTVWAEEDIEALGQREKGNVE
mgnify:CR=1 FL=1|jgi:predicted DNA-binding transcriptional regulator AlpA